jgi:hemolysin activation/secretion protein
MAACCVVWAAAAVSAQILPPATQPGIQEQRTDPGRVPDQLELTPRPPVQIDAPEKPAAAPARPDGPKVLVTGFRITGNKVIATSRLEQVVRADIDKEHTLESLRAVAAKITDYYAARGYILARAYLPPQDVREGVIELAVLEGDVGTIEIAGTERYSEGAVARGMTRVKNEGIVHEGLLETSINILNEYPGLSMRASLRPGAERGKTDILMTAQERIPFSATVETNNYGSRYTGPWKYGVEAVFPLTYLFSDSLIGDRFTFRGLKTDDTLWFTRADYSVPVGGYGTRVEASYSHSEDDVGEEFSGLNVSGRQTNWYFQVTQPFFKTSGMNLQAFALIEAIRSQQFVLWKVAGVDDLRVFRMGVSGDYRDPYLGRWYYGATLHQGVPWFGASQQDDYGATRNDGPGGFTKLTADLARLQSLVYGGSYLILRGFGQLSSQNLLSPEKFSLGGYYSVRGYPIAEQTGDQGYVVSAEVHVPVPGLREWVRFVTFFDHGGVFLVSRNKSRGEIDHWMTGMGTGLRIDVPTALAELPGGLLQIRFDYAWNVGGPAPSSHKNGISQGQPGIIYFSASLKY